MPTRSRVVILGAGQPFRNGEPSALVITSGNRRVLDWLLAAFDAAGPAEFHFVGGYRLDEIIHAYPQLHYSVNDDWATSGPVGSLLAAPIGGDATTYVCYADIVFSRDVVERMQAARGDVVIAVDRSWRRRYADRPADDMRIAEKVRLRGDVVVDVGKTLDVAAADAEYAGVCRFSPRVLEVIDRLRRRDEAALRQADMPTLFARLRDEGVEAVAVDVGGQWAELNEAEDLAHFVLGTKAETLANLSPMVTRSVIGDVHRFTVGRWLASRDEVLARLRRRFPRGRLAVRSSTTAEDGWTASGAGRYRSVLDVDAADEAALADAVAAVIASYGDERPTHQVLVQPMLEDARLSGVLTTRTLNHGAPYYTINFDADARSTDGVTSGMGRYLRTLVVSRGSGGLPASAPPELAGVLDAARELEELVGHDALDIEFAVTADGIVHVLQVRPIAVPHGYRWLSDDEITAAIEAACDEFRRRRHPPPHLLGRRAIYGIMPDWNPAEIIGPKPRRLALSLYRTLVTDEVWATQRAEYGYRDVRPAPLVMTFAGHPYVDVRASLNSFVPAALPDDLAARLVEHYLDRLRANVQFHDKIEFDVAFTCYTPDFAARARERLAPAGFSEPDVRVLGDALRAITRAAMLRPPNDLATIERLGRRFGRIMAAGRPPLERARLLLDDCRRLGTLPFAHLARGGFVATTLLRSLQATGALAADETDAFFNSLRTVVSDITRDGRRVAAGDMTWDRFVDTYGHLRPGTYEITSPSYGEDPERYLRPMVAPGGSGQRERSGPCWSEAARRRVAQALAGAGLTSDVDAFETFLRQATEGREYAKFVFTRNLNAALLAFVEFGRAAELSADDLSHLGVDDLLRGSYETPMGDAAADLRRRVDQAMVLHRISQVIELPPLVVEENDFRTFELPPSHPNFVTRHRVTAPAVVAGDDAAALAGRIVLIPQADPGFDWLFGHKIAGLVTMYGGANSHMTIRSAELDLPAAVGVGEVLYKRLAGAAVIDLDCGGRQIRVVS